MRDEVIVITGCSSGIGLETALYLKDEFPNLYPTARSEKDVERLKALGLSKTLKLDVTKPDEIDFVINKVLKEQGQIDVWFNNAGYGQMGALEDVPTSALKEQFNTNVFALHECTKKLIPIMRKQGFGKIIQHSSVLGLVSLPLRGAYNASKYAVEGLSDTLRLELKGSGVYVILLNTGPVTSKFRENALKTLKNYLDHLLVPIIGRLEDLLLKARSREEGQRSSLLIFPSPRLFRLIWVIKLG